MSAMKGILGVECWHVSAGGAVGPSFTLVLGEKVRRQHPLRNAAQPEEFQRSRGSVELLVWCSWRLQDASSVLATSDQAKDWVVALRELVGATVVAVECTPPAWDLRLEFSNGHVMMIFCDHGDEGASIAQNWELFLPTTTIRTGPGSTWEEAGPING